MTVCSALSQLMPLLILLYCLAIIDFGCCGIRTAQGRSALLNKFQYFKDAVISAVILGHAVLIVPMVALLLLLERSTHVPRLVEHLEQASRGMFVVYIPFTAVFFVGMLLRAVPVLDCKSLSSLVLLGPLTFFRPLVAICGIAAAMAFSPHMEVFALGGLAVALMLSFELLLEWLHDRKHVQKLAKTVRAT